VQNKQAIVGIAIAVFIILGAAGAYLFNANRGQEQTPQQQATKEEIPDKSTIGTSLVDLLQSDESMQCNFNYDDKENSTAGVIYIHNQRLRADISTLIDGVDSDISMVRKDNLNYIWGSPFPQNKGLMFETDLEDLETNEQFQNYFDAEKQINYNCSAWTVEETAFETPDDVEFSDLPGIVGEMLGKESEE